jgi:hypothetical protein
MATGTMTVPSFVVAGTQKAATTWLYECLREHPEVSVPDTKELHYFCDAGDCRHSQLARGIAWYTGQFPRPDGCKAVGELTIDYMYFDYVPQRLHALNPALKVIFVLRDPVDRAYSAYWMARRARADFPEFAHFLHERSDIVARGFYHRQIERFLSLFPRDQLKILLYEDIAREPRSFLREVFVFLGVDPDFECKAARQQIGNTQASPASRQRSVFFYRKISPILNSPAVLPIWRAAKHVLGLKRLDAVPRRGYPPIDPGDARKLRDIYASDVRLLNELLHRPTWPGF